MCDTLIATKLATSNGTSIFAKNSDRPTNEGQHLAYFPAQTYAPNTKVKCTYIEIPQVQKTHAVLLSKPFWMWGAEMGVNEHGLVIGNEAVYSKVPANKEPALLGMDMLRAALERSVTPREAVQVIIGLLEEFGQGGNCASHGNHMYYHNSFLIANHEDAWVLETVDKQWAARQVKDVYSISNCLTIGAQYDMASPNLVDLAIQKGYVRSRNAFNLAKDYSDFLYTTLGKGRVRRATTINTMDQHRGDITLETMIDTLRHHDQPFNPAQSITKMDVCMHTGYGPIRESQSTASLIVFLDKERTLIFATGTSAPCTGIFKPIWMDTASQQDFGPVPTSEFDPKSLFWTHEKLHRATLLNYEARINTYAADRDAMEKRFIDGAFSLHKSSAKQRADFTAQCFSESSVAEEEWLKRVEKTPVRKKFLHSIAWNNLNKKANMPVQA
jgi:dipeptidase